MFQANNFIQKIKKQIFRKAKTCTPKNFMRDRNVAGNTHAFTIIYGPLIMG